MRYIDAGYTVALSGLFAYALVLVRRRRRLEEVARAHERSTQ